MVSKEEFNKVWKDSSRENILNQFYYEHYELFRIKKEVREYIEEKEKDDDNWIDYELCIEPVVIKKILDKGE